MIESGPAGPAPGGGVYRPGPVKESLMGARKRLNASHVTGCLMLAGLAGALTGSWAAFAVAFAALLVIDVIGGNIRPDGRD